MGNEDEKDLPSSPPMSVDEEIAKLKQQIKWLLSLESAGANQRLEAFATLKNYDNTLGRLTESLLTLRQQRDEYAAASDERERLWIHEKKISDENHTKALMQFTDALAQLRASLKIKKELDGIAGKVAGTAKEAKAATEGATATALGSETTLKAIENVSKRLDELSGQHPKLNIDEIEAEEDRRPPRSMWQMVYSFGRALLRTPPTTLITLTLLIIVIFLALRIGYPLLQELDKSHLLPQPGQEHSGLK